MQKHKIAVQTIVKKFWILILVLFTSMSTSARHPEDPIYVEYADNITEKFCIDVAKTHKLFYYGGGGGFLNKVNDIILDFIHIDNLDISKARILITTCVEDLLYRINVDNSIKPYLAHYPFTEKGISLSISFKTPDQKRVSSKYVAHVLATNGSIYYSSYDHKKQEFIDLHEETYQEALKLANISSHNIN